MHVCASRINHALGRALLHGPVCDVPQSKGLGWALLDTSTPRTLSARRPRRPLSTMHCVRGHQVYTPTKACGFARGRKKEP